jgi:hypothetical protein
VKLLGNYKIANSILEYENLHGSNCLLNYVECRHLSLLFDMKALECIILKCLLTEIRTKALPL